MGAPKVEPSAVAEFIDANWGQSTDVVYQFCRQSRFAAVLLPSHGKYVGASSIPFSEYTRKKGDRVGHNWRIPSVKGKRAVRHVVYDTNYWKSFIHARMMVSMGDRGCLSLFGREPPNRTFLLCLLQKAPVLMQKIQFFQSLMASCGCCQYR